MSLWEAFTVYHPKYYLLYVHDIAQYGMKGVCAGHVRRTALVDGARIGAQNAILCLCNTTLGIHLRVHGAHNVRYKSPSGARKSNIPYWDIASQIHQQFNQHFLVYFQKISQMLQSILHQTAHLQIKNEYQMHAGAFYDICLFEQLFCFFLY